MSERINTTSGLRGYYQSDESLAADNSKPRHHGQAVDVRKAANFSFERNNAGTFKLMDEPALSETEKARFETYCARENLRKFDLRNTFDLTMFDVETGIEWEFSLIGKEFHYNDTLRMEDKYAFVYNEKGIPVGLVDKRRKTYNGEYVCYYRMRVCRPVRTAENERLVAQSGLCPRYEYKPQAKAPTAKTVKDENGTKYKVTFNNGLTVSQNFDRLCKLNKVAEECIKYAEDKAKYCEERKARAERKLAERKSGKQPEIQVIKH